ncbi:unnamed protein product [Caenorhabditis nigoni]
MPIALLKFPTDLLGEVFKLCDPFQLYCLSKCSKKTQKSIKSGGTKTWKLQFSGGNRIVTSADGLRYTFDGTQKPDNFFKIKHVTRSCSCMSIQFEDPFDVFFYLLDTFRIRVVETLGIHLGGYEVYSIAARDLIQRNIEIEEVHINYNPEVQDVDKLMPLLNQMNITQKFECRQKFPSEFRHHFDSFPTRILIHNSFWFNIEQLLECICVRIELQESILSNQDIDAFFQKWKRPGSFPNLRFLKIVSNKIDDKSPILGMIPPIFHVTRARTAVSWGADRVEDYVRVTKDDGTVGFLNVQLGNCPTLKFLA